MRKSNLPPEIWKQTIKSQDEMVGKLELEENELLTEVLVTELSSCNTIHFDAENPQTLDELAQVSEELRDLIVFDG